jgi:nucleotidyltransferase substrate binding protein (TIGR01987 family)
MKLDLEGLKKAVGSLERSVGAALDEKRMAALDEDQRDAIRAGVIQNFEFTYEQCWKMLKRRLTAMAASRDEVDLLSYRDLMRLGAEKGFIQDPIKWFDYRQQRNMTSHTYDENRADSVFKSAVSFLEDARQLLRLLKANNDDD